MDQMKQYQSLIKEALQEYAAFFNLGPKPYQVVVAFDDGRQQCGAEATVSSAATAALKGRRNTPRGFNFWELPDSRRQLRHPLFRKLDFLLFRRNLSVQPRVQRVAQKLLKRRPRPRA